MPNTKRGDSKHAAGRPRVSTKIFMLTTIIFMQSHISLISILFSLLKYLLRWGSIIIIDNRNNGNKYTHMPKKKMEYIECYEHGSDTHFCYFQLRIATKYIKIYTINICGRSHRFIIIHVWYIGQKKNSFWWLVRYFITTVKLASCTLTRTSHGSKQFSM